jgi:hypothetical protein
MSGDLAYIWYDAAVMLQLCRHYIARICRGSCDIAARRNDLAMISIVSPITVHMIAITYARCCKDVQRMMRQWVKRADSRMILALRPMILQQSMLI